MKYISSVAVIESLSIPCFFYPSIALFLSFPFLHLPVHSVGCNFKKPGMASEARLLITVCRGGVRSVRSKNKSRRVIKGMECPFVRAMPFRLGEKFLPCDSKKER